MYYLWSDRLPGYYNNIHTYMSVYNVDQIEKPQFLFCWTEVVLHMCMCLEITGLQHTTLYVYHVLTTIIYIYMYIHINYDPRQILYS